MKDGARHEVERRLRRLTSYQASPQLVVTGTASIADDPDDVPPAAIAVSGFRRLHGELHRGLTGFLFTPPLAL